MNKTILATTISLVAMIVVSFLVKSAPTAEATTQQFNGPWIYGTSDARFTITEYADLECPYCKDYFPQLKSWVDAHQDVNLQWHHLPLPMHEPAAGQEARFAECVGSSEGSQAFWSVVEMIYQQTRSNGAGLPGVLDLSAENTDHLAAAVERCAKPPAEIGKIIQHQVAEASAKGIDATPTLVVTDHRTQRSIKLLGATSDNSLLSAIDWLSTQDPVAAAPSPPHR